MHIDASILAVCPVTVDVDKGISFDVKTVAGDVRDNRVFDILYTMISSFIYEIQ
jgi:hypothetical protein